MKRILFLIIACIALHASVFGQSKINRAEWFVDTDPGVGNATLLANYTTAVDSIDNNFNLNLSSLSLNVGIHYLYIRSRNTNGEWGLTQPKPFYVLNSNGAIITNAEYFFDNDPGVGNGHSLSIAALSDSASVTTGINIGNISTGQHYLYVRMKANGQWGLTQFKPFYVSAGSGAIITNAEYFFDNDPGAGNGLPFSISAAADSATFNGGINVGNLSVGLHYAYIRMKANGQWGLTQFKSFFVTQSTGPVTWHGEYFIDKDLGVGAGTTFSAVGTADSVNYAGNFNVGNIKGGQHILYVRLKNANNEWGLTQAVSFTSNHAVAAAEYFFDNDPGVGNGHSISVSTPSDSVAFTQNISMQTAGIGFGKHWLYVRAKNELGEWGLTQRDSMYILRPANDHCDGASPLSLGTNICGGTISSSTFATDTTGLAVGICNTSNEQGDVWFYAIAPANGNIEFDINQVVTQSLKRGNMQAFKGVCGNLVNVGCANFDSSATGKLVITGLTPNDTIRVRVMGRSSYEGNFDICAFTFTNALSITATDSVICNGNSTTLTASAYAGNTFSWNPSTGLNTTSGASVVASPTTTTTYTCTATLSNSVLTKTFVVHVTPLSISATATNATICKGNSTTLNASGATSYVWNPGNLSGASISVAPSSNTTYTVTGTQGGCNATANVTVNVFNDVTPPSISACATTLNINTTSGLCGATGVSLGLPTATDNCTASGNLTFINNAPTQFSVGTTTVNWIVKDASNNQSTCSQTVTVSDNELPQVTCPSNKNVNVNSGLCYATGVSLGTLLTSDNCGVQSYSNNAPSQFSVGNTNVTWTVIDVHGNQNTCVQTVNVTDNIKPQITCGGSVTVNADLNACGYYASNLTAATATDNCSVVISNNAPTFLPIGVSTIHWYATDPSGNVDSCSQIVTVQNVTPTIIANGSTTFCNGGSVQLSCNATTGLQWYLNGNPILGATSNTYTATVSGNYEIHQSVGSCNRISNSITVTVHPNPTANAGIDQTILQGSSATLTATGGGTYSWNTGNVADTTASIIVSPIATTTYIVTVTNNFGCTAKDTVVVHVNFSSLAVAPSFYNYGNVVLNTPTNHNITLTNNGTLPITINSVTTQAPYSVSFTSQSLSAGNSINIPVTFTPTGTLIYVKNVIINTSLGNFNVTLQGKGVASSASWSISSSNYNFGNVQTGTTNTQNFNLTNTGNVPIQISTINSNNTVFNGSTVLNTIAVGQSLSLSVNFHPTAITNYSGIITVNSSTPGLSPLTLNVNGTGYQNNTPPVIQFVSASPYNGTDGVNPLVSVAGNYTYRMIYKSVNNKAPQNGFPKVGIDKNADGDFIDGGEGIFSMTKVNGTRNFVSGEEYSYTTNLPIGNQYGYQFFATDSLGNAAVSINNNYNVGPTVTNQTLDLSIYASDITFSVAHPAVNQTFTVSATIHNTTPYSASNVNVRFYTDSIYFTQTTVPFIGANSTATVSINKSYNTDGFYPVKVWVDSAHALVGEYNVLNNYAIRPIIVGNFTVPGAINVVANATPQSCPVGGISICGNAKYSGLNLVGTPPVLGGTVTVSIGGSVVATTNTATDGTYCIFYNNSGNGLACGVPYTYTVTVTDYTLTATTSTFTFTIPCVSCGGGGGGGVSYEPNFSYSSGASSCIIENQSSNYTTSFTNNGNAKSYRDTFKIFVDGNLSYTHTLDSMAIAQNISYNDAFTLSAGNHTLSFTHTYYNAANTKSTVNGSNVINVIFNKPDLYLAYFTQTSGTAFSVRNYNGSCVNAPISKTYVYDSMAGFAHLILIDSIVSPLVGGNSYVVLTLNKPALAQGFHYLTLKTDGRNLIAELNETNNELNAVLYVPLPELSIRYITVSNNNAPTGSVVNFLASVQNTGANCGAFKVRFTMNGNNIGNKISVANLNAGDSVLVTSDAFTIPSDSCTYSISAIADVDNQITELNESNNTNNFNFGRDFSAGLSCYATGSSCNPYSTPVGSTLTMNTLVYNNGLRDADTLHVRFKLGSTILGTDNVSHLAALANSTVSITHTFNTVGSYAIEVNADYDNKYCEENESNNIGYIYVTVTSGTPDLQILSQDISPSNLNPNPNQNITIVSSIHNYGNLKSNPCSVRFYVDNVQLGIDVPIDTLYPGQDTTVAATALYSNALVGPKIIKVKADVFNVIAESNESNNEATRAIIVGGAPDFAKSLHEGITFSKIKFRKGDSIQVCDYIRNYGGDTGTAVIKFFSVTTSGRKLIDSLIFTLNDHDSSKFCVNWVVNDYNGRVVTQISRSNPPEFDVLNNNDSANFHAGPKLLPTLHLSPSSVCYNNGENISAAILSDGQALSYQWKLGANPVGNNATNYAITNAVFADSGFYHIEITDTFGTVISRAAFLKVKSLPIINVTGPTTTVCIGLNSILTASGAANYFWTPGSLNTASINVSPSATTTYVVTGTASNGCSASNSFVLSMIFCGKPQPNDDPCAASNASSAQGHVANEPAANLFGFDNGAACFSGIPDNRNSSPPLAPNLVYYTGNTFLAVNNFSTWEPIPTCGATTGAKTIWLKFKAPTINEADVEIRTDYSTTSPAGNTWILAAYRLTGGTACFNPVFTRLLQNGAIPYCSSNGILHINSADLAAYRGGEIYLQMMAPNGGGGTYMVSVHGIITNPSTSSSAVTTTTIPVSYGTITCQSNNLLKYLFWRPTGTNGYNYTSVAGNATNYTIQGLASGVTYDIWSLYRDGYTGSALYEKYFQNNTETGCSAGVPLPAPTVVAPYQGHCSRANVSISIAGNAAIGHLIAGYPYRLYWQKAGASGYSVVALQSATSTTANPYIVAGLSSPFGYNFWYVVICNGGAQVRSSTTTSSCSGQARVANENGTYEVDGVYFVNQPMSEVAAYYEATHEVKMDGIEHYIDIHKVDMPNAMTMLDNAIDNTSTSTSQELSGSFNLLPNPTTDRVKVEYNLPSENLIIASVKLMDMAGRIIRTINIDKPSKEGYVSLDLADLNSGIYLVNITTEGYTETKKLVVSK